MHRAALLLCLALPFAAPAQEDPDFQFLQSLTQTRYWDLGRPTSIRVTPDGSAFTVAVTNGGDVVRKGVEPDVHYVIFVTRNRHAPRNGFFLAADRQILKP